MNDLTVNNPNPGEDTSRNRANPQNKIRLQLPGERAQTEDSSMFTEINIYTTFQAWNQETPDVVLRGTVKFISDGYLEICDENGYNQILNLDKLFAVVYR